jgi:hypothetical protein
MLSAARFYCLKLIVVDNVSEFYSWSVSIVDIIETRIIPKLSISFPLEFSFILTLLSKIEI